MILWSATVWAQKSTLTQSEKQIAYENALLDSAYRYELLKPTFYSLKSAYEAQHKGIEEYKIAMQLSKLQVEAMQKQAAIDQRNARKNQRKALYRGIGIGVSIGLLITIITH